MGNPELKKVNLEEMAYFPIDNPFAKKAWVMDPPPWLKISEAIRINIYKEQLKFRAKEIEIQIQQLRNEMEMLNASMKMLG